tara:strand:+ start:45 stop:311 length:267 start_codon:yes stop_codon:yes gene_type:complete
MKDIINKNPYILCLILSIVGVGILYIDDTFIKKKKQEMLHYIKIISIIFITIGITIYILNNNNILKGGGLEDITDIVNEQIHTGNPNF